jgi:hypothetical protein
MVLPALSAPASTPGPREWPSDIQAGPTTFTIHQPQIESWDGFRTSYSAALSARADKNDTPIFGVATFSARSSIDKNERLVTFDDVKLESLRFPSAPERETAWLAAIQDKVGPMTTTYDLDRFEAALAVVRAGRKSEDLPLKSDPPRLVFSTTAAMLILVDGAPAYRPVTGTTLQRVINSRVLLVRDGQGRHFLKLYDGWMSAASIEGPWGVATSTHKDLGKALQTGAESKDADLLVGGDPQDPKTRPTLKRDAPAIVIATSPTELIVTEGEQSWVPVDGTQLVYVSNTTGNVFRLLSDQQIYVLLSGRWFRSPSLGGPWQSVPNDALPADFARIPEDSPKENVKASVAGTPQAEEALIANSIPQTAAVNRNEAKMAPPVIDGAVQTKSIEGTTLQYVANSPTPIIVVSPKSYYAVTNGVWFTASSTAGPWSVATSVPPEIYSIPPSSPVHNVTYVRVYSSSPTVVYVGYTPGYYGTCVYRGTVVYGTGYYYSRWVGRYWYAPPVTYGYAVAVAYTPWTGWTVGFGYGWGYSTVYWGAYPYWGPYYHRYGGAAVGYRGVAAWGPGGWAATTGNVYSRWGARTAVTRTSAGYNAWTGNAWATQVGRSYNSRTGVATAGQRAAVQNVYTGNYATGARGVATGPGGTTAAGRTATVGNAYTGRETTVGKGTVYNPNTGNATSVGGVKTEQGSVVRLGDDVYGSRDGTVYRRDENGWQQRSTSDWQQVDDKARTQSLDAQQRARSQGRQRTEQYRSGSYRKAGSRESGSRNNKKSGS